MITEGESKCLNTFMVALNQACDGQEKRWYTSTLELQLVSLGFCEACRSVQTLHVRVDRQKPPSLWSPCKSRTTFHTCNPEVFISSRVPTVQAFGLTWALPMEVKLHSSATELQSRSQGRHRAGLSSAASQDSVVWLERLKRLVISSDMPVFTASWPVSLQQLSFGDTFNQPIAEVVWPASLQQLSFGDCFNQPIAAVVWPVFLQQLSFGGRFNQPIAKVVWPASLEQLSFGVFFDQPIADVMWPATLQRLLFGDTFIHPIAGVVWPASLEQLSFGGSFNQPIADVTWPASLQQLSLGYFFNQPIKKVAWSASLHQI